MSQARSRFRQKYLIPWLALPALLAGCNRPSALTLYQPHAPTPVQREIRLNGSWTYYAVADGRRDCLLAFPLPGTEDGPRDFLVYLTGPDALGDQTVNAADPHALRGFLIQMVGQMRGKAEFTGGTVRSRKEPLRGETRRLELDLHCEDGTRVVGTAYAALVPQEVRSFEKRYAGDVALLKPAEPPASQPAESPPAQAADQTAPPAEATNGEPASPPAKATNGESAAPPDAP